MVLRQERLAACDVELHGAGLAEQAQHALAVRLGQHVRRLGCVKAELARVVALARKVEVDGAAVHECRRGRGCGRDKSCGRGWHQPLAEGSQHHRHSRLRAWSACKTIVTIRVTMKASGTPEFGPAVC